MRVVAADSLDSLIQTEFVWLHRDIKSLPQEIAEPGAVARTPALDSVHPVKGAVARAQQRLDWCVSVTNQLVAALSFEQASFTYRKTDFSPRFSVSGLVKSLEAVWKQSLCKTTFYAVSMVRLKTELLEDRSPIMLLGISNSLIC